MVGRKSGGSGENADGFCVDFWDFDESGSGENGKGKPGWGFWLLVNEKCGGNGGSFGEIWNDGDENGKNGGIKKKEDMDE